MADFVGPLPSYDEYFLKIFEMTACEWLAYCAR